MFEFHGWATLREGVCESQDDEGHLAQIVEAVNAKIATVRCANREIGLRAMNGSWSVWIAGNHNHASTDVVGFFQFLADTAPGAYGLLHIWDDEGPWPNAFQVWVLRRGTLKQREDRHLSPCMPTIEDGDPSPHSVAP